MKRRMAIPFEEIEATKRSDGAALFVDCLMFCILIIACGFAWMAAPAMDGNGQVVVAEKPEKVGYVLPVEGEK